MLKNGSVFTIVLLVISACINIFQTYEIKKLRSAIEIEKLKSELNPGTTVSEISAKSLDGNKSTITYAEKDLDTILYIFSPQCVWCKRNERNIKSLVDKTKSNHRIIGISLSENGLREYVKTRNIDFPVYYDVPKETELDYKLGSTPQTIVISKEGKVIKNWQGAYSDSVLDEIQSYFKVELPGLID